jgi:flagellar biosynthetic protein FlhB
MTHSGERTEKATPRRLLKARREGQFASSRDFIGGLQFAVFVLVLSGTGEKLFQTLRSSTRVVFQEAFRADLNAVTLIEIVHEVFAQTLFPLAAASGLLVASALLFQLGSTGFSISLQKMAPKAANFDFISKLKSTPGKGIASAVQGVALLVVFGFAIYWLVAENLARLLALPLTALGNGLEVVRALSMNFIWKAAAFFVLFGVIDLFRQRSRFAKQMRMSKQEVRDELKETEGNPQIKVRIRRLQRDARRRRMVDEVKTATAVIVNPTHYAVAIRYHHESMVAPLVVAKGKNYLALRIRARALEHQIPLIENPPLAQALYKSVQVGQPIPAHLYRAVAEILAYIYRLMGAKTVS